jgi:hypothetical protein
MMRSGHLHGFRGSIERARELAANIPSSTWTPPPPPEPSRSPDALPPPPSPGVPAGPPRDERPSLLDRPAKPNVIQAYSRSKSMTRRHHQR